MEDQEQQPTLIELQEKLEIITKQKQMLDLFSTRGRTEDCMLTI